MGEGSELVLMDRLLNEGTEDLNLRKEDSQSIRRIGGIVIGGRDQSIELDISRNSYEFLYVLNIGLLFIGVSFNIYT